MSAKKQTELPFTEKSIVSKDQLLFVSQGSQISSAQAEFNRLMKRLEKEREKQKNETSRLEAVQKDVLLHVFPLIEDCNRLNRDICKQVNSALKRIKFSKRQRSLLVDLLCSKVSEVLDDRTGLTQEDCDGLAAILEEHTPADAKDLQDQAARDELADLVENLKSEAAAHGHELDFSGIDMDGDPEEVARQIIERLYHFKQSLPQDPFSGSAPRKRKLTKAQQEKERKRLAQEEAKQKDLKSLYKQLAKAIHPDLENDPEMKLQKEAWMQRLTAAHAAGDLSELLRIEMEWLGEESYNLAKASEEKLKIYHAVLKEQINEVKRQTQTLIFQPQFQILSRFVDSYSGYLPSFYDLLAVWKDNRNQYQYLLSKLDQGDTAIRLILKDWAEAHGQALRDDDCPF